MKQNSVIQYPQEEILECVRNYPSQMWVVQGAEEEVAQRRKEEEGRKMGEMREGERRGNERRRRELS